MKKQKKSGLTVVLVVLFVVYIAAGFASIKRETVSRGGIAYVSKYSMPLYMINPAMYGVTAIQDSVYSLDDDEEISSMYELTAEVMCPAVESFDVHRFSEGSNFSFSGYEQDFDIYLFSDPNRAAASGVIKYGLNNVKSSLDTSVITDSIKTQSFYLNVENPVEPPDDDGYYLFYFGLKDTMKSWEMLDALKPFAESSDYRRGESRIAWLAYRTSNKDYDIALGLSGKTDEDDYVNNYYESSEKGSVYALDLILQRKLAALNTSDESKTALASGVFGRDAMSVDYLYRDGYLRDNDVSVIGVVLYTTCSQLELIDENFVLLDYCNA